MAGLSIEEIRNLTAPVEPVELRGGAVVHARGVTVTQAERIASAKGVGDDTVGRLLIRYGLCDGNGMRVYDDAEDVSSFPQIFVEPVAKKVGELSGIELKRAAGVAGGEAGAVEAVAGEAAVLTPLEAAEKK